MIHGPDDDAIGQRRHGRRPQAGRPVLPDVRGKGGAALQGDDEREGKGIDDEEPGDIAEAGAGMADAEAVGHAIGRNGEAGEAREEDRSCMIAARPAPPEGEARDAQRHQDHAQHLPDVEGLPRGRRGRDGDQQRRKPARQRIDQAEIAGLIHLGEAVVIADMDGDRAQDEGPARRIRRHDEEQQRQTDQAAHEHDQRRRQLAIAADLDQGVPGRMENGGQEHEQDDEEG